MSDFGIVLEKGLIGLVLGGSIAILYCVWYLLAKRKSGNSSAGSATQRIPGLIVLQIISMVLISVFLYLYNNHDRYEIYVASGVYTYKLDKTTGQTWWILKNKQIKIE